jgi:rhodanese-related sulfurtransferase
MTLYRRELVDLETKEGQTLMECLVPSIMNKDLKQTVSDRIKRLARQLHAQYFDVDPDMLLKLLQDYLQETQKDWNYIKPPELHKFIEAGKAEFFLVDVRRPEDYEKSHIPGAINIFWLEILQPDNIKKLPVDKTILVYCYVGHTSSQVMVLLSLIGYRCKSLKYGMGVAPDKGEVKGWLGYKYPLEGKLK